MCGLLIVAVSCFWFDPILFLAKKKAATNYLKKGVCSWIKLIKVNFSYTYVRIKWKNKKSQTVRKVVKSKRKIVKRGKFATPNTRVHDLLFTWPGPYTSIKSGGVKLIWWTQTSQLSFPYVINFIKKWKLTQKKTLKMITAFLTHW